MYTSLPLHLLSASECTCPSYHLCIDLCVCCSMLHHRTLLFQVLSPPPDSTPSLWYCHPCRTLPFLVSSLCGCPLSSHDMTSTPRLHPILVVALQSAQLTVHPAIASSAPSNLSLPGLVHPLLSALYCHCSVLSHCTTVFHAVLIVPPLVPSALV